MAACNVGCMSLFVCSILWDLNVPQEAATIMYEDNDGYTAMGNAQKPMTRTRHINIKWDIIHLEMINISINIANHLTKPLSQVLFHWHANILLGHVPPIYSPVYQHIITTYGDHFEEDIDSFLPDSFTTPMTAKAAQIYAPTHNDVRGNPWLNVLWHE
jgi:hypothetical protein